MNQAEVSEPLWRAGLSIAKFCSDGSYSRSKNIRANTPEYNEADMRKKMDEIKGPYTCARFDDLERRHMPRTVLCGARSNRRLYWVSVFGRSEGEVAVSAPIVKAGVKKSEDFEIPEYPKPYFRGSGGWRILTQ